LVGDVLQSAMAYVYIAVGHSSLSQIRLNLS
jgi:hypothetical protein